MKTVGGHPVIRLSHPKFHKKKEENNGKLEVLNDDNLQLKLIFILFLVA